MRRFIFLAFSLISIFRFEVNAQTYHSLLGGPLIQDWTNIGLITINDDWSGVPSIRGFLGDYAPSTSTADVDPQTILVDMLTIDVNANQTAPNTFATGGVAEFHITNPTIALNGSGTADAPNLIFYLNTIGHTNIRVQYNLRDLDGSIDNATQQFALQYRIGTTGPFINIPAGYVADATTGPSLATLVTAIDVTLPAACNNQPQVQVRVITSNAGGNDEWVGIDDINISGQGEAISISINDISLNEGNAGPTLFNFTVSLSQPAGAGGVTFDIFTQDNSAIAPGDYTSRSLTSQVIPQNTSTYNFIVSVNGDNLNEQDENFTVRISNVVGATVTDDQGVGNILNDECTATNSIHDIQGPGSVSPLSGVVTTTGIVTAQKSNGFFIQSPESEYDGNSHTSEGIFVFTAAAPPATAAIGNMVCVTGTVAEFIPSTDPYSQPQTELTFVTVNLVTTGNPLPAPIVITAAETNPNLGLEQLEKYEGMRVKINSLTVVGPTDGNKSEVNATSISNGFFHGVITGIPRPFREPGIQVPDPLPPGAPPAVPRWDFNPELLAISSSSLTGSLPIDVKAGAILTNVIGPLDIRSRLYNINIEPLSPPTITNNSFTYTPVSTPTTNQLTVASFNLERFYDDVDDLGGDVQLNPVAYNNRLNKASLAIRDVLKTPDVIGVVEVEKLSVLQTLANKINSDAVLNSQPDPMYVAYLVEGNDPGGIDNGFLVRSNRVTVDNVVQEGAAATYINPENSQPEILNDRPPLVLNATFTTPGCNDPHSFTVIANHLRSLIGVDEDPGDGNRVRTKRRAQAEFLANLIQTYQTADPNRKIISLGDFNAFEFNDGFVDMIGTIKGTPTPAPNVTLSSPDLVNPDLIDLIESVPADQRYSFSFNGNAQELDHILITGNLLDKLDGLQYGRSNTDFPESLRGNPASPIRLSDHDPLLSYFTFPDLTPPVLINLNIGCSSLNRINLNQCLGTATSFDPTSLEDEVAALYQDNCAEVVSAHWILTTEGVGNSDCSWSFTYRFSIVDAYENSTTCEVVYSGGNRDRPRLRTGASCESLHQLNIEQCLSQAAAFDPRTLEDDVAALYKDNCGSPVTATLVSSGGNSTNSNCQWTFGYRFKIQDACGNSTEECLVVYQGGDNQAPHLINPAVTCASLGNGNLDWCYIQAATYITPLSEVAALYTDECGFVGASFVNRSITGNNCRWDLTLTFRIYDGCNNETYCTIDYRGGDHEAPHLVNPNIGCSSLNRTNVNQCVNNVLTPAFTSMLTQQVKDLYTDNCDQNIDVSLFTTTPGGIMTNCQWSFRFLFRIMDDCLNVTTCEVLYGGGDNEAPHLAQANVGCGSLNQGNINQCLAQAQGFDPTTLEDDVAALYADNCDPSVKATWIGTGGTNNTDCNWQIIYHFRIEDDCENFVLCDVLYSGGDREVPHLLHANVSCASLVRSNLNQCLSQAEAFDPRTLEDDVAALYTDNCASAVTVEWERTISGTNNSDCSWTLTYQFRIKDNCENIIRCTVVYSGGDQEAPHLQNPALDCSSLNQSNINQCLLAARQFNGSSLIPAVRNLYTDNCNNNVTVASVTQSEVAQNSNCNWTINYSFRIIDACNNQTICVVSYSGRDQQAPTMQCPANVTVQCTSAIPPHDFAGGTVQDNCDPNPAVEWLSDVISNIVCVNRYTITRTYKATDICGNSTTCTQTIQVYDNIPPTFTRPPDKTISYNSTCDYNADPSITGNPTNMADNCGGTVTISFFDMFVECGNDLVIRRTWTASDGCNSSSHEQMIRVTNNNFNFNSNYIVYAGKEAKFGQSNMINGDVGVTAANGKADFDKHSVLDPNHVYAKTINVHSPATVNNLHLIAATGGPNPPFFAYAGGGLSGNHTQSVNGIVPPGNFKNLTIKKGVTATINGSNYGKVTIEENARVTFTSNSIDMEELNVKKGKSPGTTTMDFLTCTAVRIEKDVDIEDDSRVNVGGPKLVFYMSNNKEFRVKADNAQVTAIVYGPGAKLKMHGGNTDAIMTGLFIVEKLDGDAKNVTWNKYDCFLASRGGEQLSKKETLLKNLIPEWKGMFEPGVSPNPSTGEFRIQVKTSSEEKLTIRIFDVSGKTIRLFNNVSPHSAVHIGATWVQGTYFAEVIQGANRKTLKLLKTE